MSAGVRACRRWAAPVFGAAAALWLAWWAAGGVSREGALQPKAGFKRMENAWTVSVPRDLRGRLTAASTVVWEEGKPLWRPSARKVVEGGEPGSCFVRRDVVVFVPSDSSDPNTNGHHYTLRGPAALPWGWVVGIGVLLATLQMVSQPPGRSVTRPSASWSSSWSVAVFLAGFTALAVWVWLHPDYNDGFMMAKGCPYSDAQVWLELGHSLACGFGLEGFFAAQRPLYPVLLAPWLAAGAPPLLLVQMLNAAAGALTATLLGALAARAAGWATGLGVAAVIAFTGVQAGFLPLAMSETVAMSFVALGLVFLFQGMQLGRLWPLAVAGGLFGLANLVCSFTPLALVLSGGVAAWAGFCRQRRWTALVTHGGVVALGAAMVLGPWVLRQRAVYGVATLSLQAAEMLYAPVSSTGHYSPGLVEEPAKAGVPDEPAARYRFFAEQWRRKVTADPAAYARTLCANLGEFCATYPLEAVPLRALLVLAAAAAAWRLASCGGGWSAWAAAAAAGTLIASIDWWPRGWGFLLVAAGAAASRKRERRWLALLLLALVLGAGMMDALTGNSITRRFWSAAEGAVVVLAVMAVVNAVEGLSFLFARAARTPPPPPIDIMLGSARVGWFGTGAAIVLTGWAVVATGWVIWRTRVGPDESAWSISGEQSDQAWGETLRRIERAPGPLSVSPAWVRPVEFTGRGCQLGAGENIHHWSRAFAHRPEARTVTFVRVLPERRLQCLEVPGGAWPPDAEGRFVVVGINNEDPRATLAHDTEIIEVLAVFPVSEAAAEKVDYAQGTVFAPSAEARRIMAW